MLFRKKLHSSVVCVYQGDILEERCEIVCLLLSMQVMASFQVSTQRTQFVSQFKCSFFTTSHPVPGPTLKERENISHPDSKHMPKGDIIFG